MNKLLLSLTTLGFAAALSGGMAWAQEMDVDQADSLNFEGFHKDKKESVKVWKDGKGIDAAKGQPVKVYDQTPPASTASASNAAPAAKATTPAAIAPATATASAAATQTDGEVKPGQRYEIRERYTLTRSTKTPYSAFYVLEPMYKQAGQLCPRGWKKVAERSEPVEQDFYLYFVLECL